ncbi:MAG: S8 family serine peptidase [Planctomycetota bacterium]|nr:S8 family serine peptidase [Planctomycetota bacterium]
MKFSHPAGLALAALFTLSPLAPATQEAAGPPATPELSPERPAESPGWFVLVRPHADHHAAVRRLGELRAQLGQERASGSDSSTSTRAEFEAQVAALRAMSLESSAAARGLATEVTATTWLVPGFAVGQLDAETRAALAGRDDVLDVQEVRWQLPQIKTATDAAHHDADGAHALSSGGLALTGHGVEIAVLDSGIDLDMNGTGRPHKAFFVGGDPLDLSGGGIGGSRVLTSSAAGSPFYFGPQTPEDIHGHGTRVASTIAAAKWSNGLDVDDSMAFSAKLHNLKISDDSFTHAPASTLVMSNRFEDAVANPAIRVANMSYDGDPVTGYFLNRTIDEASNAGLFVTLSAGNFGSDLTFAHGAYNALVVGGSYEFTPFPYFTSAVGPLDPLGSSPRRYPDMIAQGESVSTARLDAEHLYTLASGTSLSSGFVAGAAALLFQAAPDLTPVEAKALLLQHTWAAGGDPNATGLGYLRVKESAEAALAGEVRGGLIDGDGSVVFDVDLTAGQAVRYTLAWERDPTGLPTTPAMDFDLTVDDPYFTQVASSATDFDVEEQVEFVAAVTGTYRIKIQEPGGIASGNPVAFALAGPGLGACGGVDVSSFSPIESPAVHAPGTSNVVNLTGCGLDQVTAVSVGGTPVAFLASDAEHMQLDLPNLTMFGPTLMTLDHPGGQTSTKIFLGPTDPLLFGPLVWTPAGPGTLTYASQPGDLHLLFVSPDLAPSSLPDLVDLDIGNGFASLHLLDSRVILGGTSFGTWTWTPGFHVFAMTVHVQSVVVPSAPFAPPLATSNVYTTDLTP